jgi:hypothetical protein
MVRLKEKIMSKELALVPTKEEFDIIQMMAKTASDSKHFEKLGGFPGIFSLALYAREMGIPAMTALHGGLVSVMGKITMSAEMMNSLIRQKGHKLEILECNARICRIKGTRKDTGEIYTAEFSLEDAKRAGLIKNGGGYDKHTDDMLFARCISKLKRRLFPDVACKAYVEGELEDSEEETESVKEESKIVEINIEEVKPSMMTDGHSKEIYEIIDGEVDYLEKILKHYKVSSLENIPDDQYELIRKKAIKYKEARPVLQERRKEPSVFDDMKSEDLPI